MILSLLIAAAILDFVLALVVLKNSSKNWQNRYFAIFVAFGGLWAAGDALMLFSRQSELINLGIELYLIAPTITTLFLVYFVHIFPREGKEQKLNPIFLAFAAASTFACLIESTRIVSIVAVGPRQNLIMVEEPGYFLYSSYFVVSLTYVCILLWDGYNRRKGLEKAQIGYSLAGILFAALLSGATNIFLPNIGIAQFVWVGPLSSLFFGMMIGIAIVKHRLFDIRLVVARSLAYLFSFSVLAAAYIGLSYILASRIFSQNASDLSISGTNIVLLIFAAATFSPLKRFFDKITNRIFYREAYDPQAFLDELNKVIVSSVELSVLINGTAAVIEKNLKSQACGILIVRRQDSKPQLAGGNYSSLEHSDIKYICSELDILNQKIVLTDELRTEHKYVKKFLVSRSVACCIRLSAERQTDDQPLAYMLLGPKKSDNLYNKQDIKILEIIAAELVIAIQNALRFEEIQEFNITLQARIHEATGELTRANEKLKALDTTKDEFISMASHQLRTPLTSVKGYLSMVLEGEGGKLSGVQRKLLDQAFVSSQRMVYLISDLLNVSRLKTGKFIINPSAVNLADMVESEIAQLSETARAKNITLEYKKPKGFPSLQLDETKTRQVIMNFADNAIYYTPSGGYIRIELSADTRAISFAVVDTGLGVPKDEQSRLFAKFFRASNAKKARPDGTGLGLYMAKRVISAQGGKIIFKSQEGKGSTFGFEFKLK